MPLQISSTTFAMLMAILNPGPADPSNSVSWRIVDQSYIGDELAVSGQRAVASADDCLAQARAEAVRLHFGAERRIDGGPVSMLRFADSPVSFSCVQVAPGSAEMAVNGPAQLLRDAGYKFSWE
ncbi:MAG: hypothetical protein R3E68_20800 [Burkholderiaceae bacterium]